MYPDKPSQKRLLQAALLGALIPAAAAAAPGTLSSSPLFLTGNSEPNILFLLDDSGSMDWEVMTEDYANGGRFGSNQPDGTTVDDAGDIQGRVAAHSGTGDCSDGGYDGEYIYGVEFGSNSYTDDSTDCRTADDRSWRFRNHDFNPLYFDPAQDYEPWPGVDSDGNAFTDADITNAPNDPYNPTEHIDLTQHTSNWTGDTTRDASLGNGFYFYTWEDTDGDGNFDNDDQGDTVTEYQVSALTDAQAATWGKTAAELKQDFANWFTYYRSRDYMAKAAYGRVIAESDGVRMGLATLHNNNSVNTAIASMNSDPASGNKKALLDALYSFDPSGGTPLRDTLYDCGEYLECVDNDLFASCPALSTAEGGHCQQNFTVAMTDGFYNGSFSAVSNNDGDDDSDWDSGTSGPYGDDEYDSLADIAMHFYERDLHPSLADEVPTTPGVDEADHQHMVTYSVAFGVNGTLDAMPPNDIDDFAWPDPDDGNAEKIDDVRHAAFNGRGLFLDAGDPDELSTALSDAIADIADRTGSAASVAFNSGTLSTGSMVYLSVFNSSNWTGQLFAYALDPVTGDVATDYTWDAAEQLDDRDLGTSPRTILTYNGTDGVPFQWSNLTTAQKDDLRTNPAGGTDADSVAQSRLDFLRGDRSNEGTGESFRIRGSRLGDIVHSNPVFVGKPQMNWPDTAPFPTDTGETYSDFEQSSAASREEILYVGANDGMLHGFKASDGEEVLGYVPSSLFTTASQEGLHFLTDPSYEHRYHVDLSSTVADAYVKTQSSDSSAAWHTILIGGNRGGGRGYFALDITDPSLFSDESNNADEIVMWEFTGADDTDLGYTYSTPTVTMMNNGRWAAVFGNGYNNTGTGEAQLFIVFLDGGLDGTWTVDTDYIKITTGADNSGNGNGLATPAVIDLDGNGTADRVYAGDLEGNMWAFDLSDSDPANWAIPYTQGGSAEALFTAEESSTAQPITTEPMVVKHPEIDDSTSPSNAPNVLVLFGTGQYVADGDPSTTEQQSFYGVWDQGDSALGRTDLQEQTFRSGFPSDVRVLTDNSVAYTDSGGSQQFGWYIDLPTSGERVVVRPQVRGDIIFFNTMIPSTDICSYGGTGWLMAAKTVNGGNPSTSSPVFDYDDDNAVTGDDVVTDDSGNDAAAAGREFTQGLPAQSAFLSNYQYTPGSQTDEGDEIDKQTVQELENAQTGRLSWIELIPD